MENFFSKGQSKVCLFVVRISLDTLLGVGHSKTIVLIFDMRERSVGIIDGNLLFRHILFGMFYGLGIAINGSIEAVSLECLIALCLELFTFFELGLHLRSICKDINLKTNVYGS